MWLFLFSAFLYAKSIELPIPLQIPDKSKVVKKCSGLDAFQAISLRKNKCLAESLSYMDVNEKNLYGHTLLHHAIAKKNSAAMNLLVKRGANLLLQNRELVNPIEYAELLRLPAVARKLRLVELETERLFQSVENGDLVKANASILRGASLGTTNVRGDTPLHRAAQSNHSELVELLLRSGADPHSKNYLGETPLHSAALRGFVETAKVLLSFGSNPSLLDHRRRSVLDLAFASGNSELTKILEEKGAKEGVSATEALDFSDLEGASFDPK